MINNATNLDTFPHIPKNHDKTHAATFVVFILLVYNYLPLPVAENSISIRWPSLARGRF